MLHHIYILQYLHGCFMLFTLFRSSWTKWSVSVLGSVINLIILTLLYTYRSIQITVLLPINFSQYFLAIICPFLVMRVCHLEKVDQIRDHVRKLMAPKKRDSSVKHLESEHKEAQSAAIELEPVGSDAGQARMNLLSSLASPERPLLV